MIEYRKMDQEDITAGLALCRSAGWNQLENDWRIFLTLNPQGCRVAVDSDGKVIGTVTSIKYGDHFSWIGMVLVDPSKKRQGIGTQLLLEALEILKDQDTVKLDATPAGREVYLKLGFRDEYTLSRMMAEEISNLPSASIKQQDENDLELIIKKDEQIFGASRKPLLLSMRKNAPHLAFVTQNASSPTVAGYCFGRNGYHYTQIGPVVADSLDHAVQLTGAALKNIKGPVIMDVIPGSPFSQWLTSIGFREQRKLIRMYRGSNAYPGTPEKQFAILGPEFG